MLNGQIEFNYNAMLSEFVGEENGLKVEDLKALSQAVKEVHSQIHERKGKGADFLGFLDLPYQDEAELDRIIAVGNQLAESSDIHVALGIGGSYLGAKALIQGLCHPYHNELPRSKRNQRPRMYFEGNNMDSDALKGLMDLLPENTPTDLSESWSINVISKSGGTIETAVTFRLLRQLAESHYGDKSSDYIVATTDASKGKLKKLANQKGYQTFVIPDDVGGRYSILTPVGLLPAAVAGIDIKQLVAGARDMAELCKSDDLFNNPAYLYAGLQYLSWKAGKGVSVMNIWDKALEYIGFWYDQLCAESIGKDEKGRVPLTAVSTRDLHARGQQLQDGERNTIITNIFVKASDNTLSIFEDPDNFDELNYTTKHSVHEMLACAYQGTNFAYNRDKRPTMSFVLAERNAYCLGALFYLLEVATVAEGYLMDIHPLNQPGVEDYKKFMFGILGREDMKEHREEFEARKPDKDAFVL